MNRSINKLALILLVTIFQACASGQTELVKLTQETQREAILCREKLTEARVDAKVARERAERSNRDLEELEQRSSKQLTSLSQQLEAALSERPSALMKPGLRRETGADSALGNLRELDHKQLVSFVNQAGGKAKRVGRHLMAVFGDIKTQIIYNPKDHVLTAHARFKGYRSDLSFINDWNRTKRFSRAYLDKDKDIVLESEVDVEPGLSSEAIRSWLRGFGLVLNFFQHSLVKESQGRAAPKGRGAPKRHRI